MTGRGTTNTVSEFTGASRVGNSQIAVSGQVGIGATNPTVTFEVKVVPSAIRSPLSELTEVDTIFDAINGGGKRSRIADCRSRDGRDKQARDSRRKGVIEVLVTLQ